MMITKDNLPKSYIPFNHLTLCSNRIIGGGYIVSIGNTLPIVLGQGNKPMIWLQAVTDAKANKFSLVVDASISKHPAVKVLEDGDTIKVSVGVDLVLEVKSDGEGSAIVNNLDLRPLGINMFGDNSKLQAGGMTFSNSTFQGVGTIIAFGE